MTGARRRALVPPSFADLSRWTAPDEDVFDESTRLSYTRRKQAVEMYVSGATFTAISEATSIQKKAVIRFVKRCVTASDDGTIAGFRALVPWHRLAGYERRAPVLRALGDGPSGCAGALSQLFSRFPEVEQSIRNRYLGGGAVPVVRVGYMELHGEFLDQLRALGFTENDWPFNTKNGGYKALRSFCLGLLAEQPSRWFGARAGEDAQRRAAVGTGHRSVFPTLRGYGACQLDFHKVDAASTLILETAEGARLPVVVSRWHIGFLIEERWNLVLGAFAALELTPSGDSVLEVIESALRPLAGPSGALWCQYTVDGKVLPLEVMPELAYQGFSVLKMDNAWSNAGTEVVDNIIRTVGCAVNFGPAKAWWRRHPIERIFGKLTQRGLQRLPSTLGSGPKDTRRSNPHEQAMRFEITIKDLNDVIKGCTREHNESIDEGNSFNSPMGALQHSLREADTGVFLQPMPRAAQQDFRLLSHVEVVTVRGSCSKNVRPYVTLGRWKYTNTTLANSYDLIGRDLMVYCDRRDVQVAHATVLDTGEQLGALHAPSGRQGQHVSWRNRVLMNQAGLSLRNLGNSTSVATQFSQAKEDELRERNQLKRNRKRASKDALAVAKVQTDELRREQRSTQSPAPVIPPAEHPPRKEASLDFLPLPDTLFYIGD